MKKAKVRSTAGGSVGMLDLKSLMTRFTLLTCQIVQSHLASATAMYESSTENLYAQRQNLDASTEKLLENLVKISEIQHSISRLNTENMTFVRNSINLTIVVNCFTNISLFKIGRNCSRSSKFDKSPLKIKSPDHIAPPILQRNLCHGWICSQRPLQRPTRDFGVWTWEGWVGCCCGHHLPGFSKTGKL